MKELKKIVSILIILLAIPIVSADYRQKYCDSNGCVMEEVFSQLPEYPKNFDEIWALVYYNRLSYLENFSLLYPDENYYKQPEFYANTFKEQGLEYYTKLKPNVTVRYNVAGFGVYPADIGFFNATQGEVLEAVAFWQTSWGVVKYQGFSLEPIFPEEAKIRIGDIQIKQDPRIAKKCFDVSFDPKIILLEPTYPVFYYNWTIKTKVTIKVNENCPNGWYVIFGMPTDVPKKLEDEWLRKYGLGLATIKTAVPWQIFVQVVGEEKTNTLSAEHSLLLFGMIITTIATVSFFYKHKYKKAKR